METIHIDFGPDGAVVIEALGYTGTACTDATAFIEEVLGVTQQREHKPEYHQAARSLNHNRNSNRQRLGGGSGKSGGKGGSK